MIGCLTYVDDSEVSCKVCKENFYNLFDGTTNKECQFGKLPTEAKPELCEVWYKTGNDFKCKYCKDGCLISTTPVNINSVNYFVCNECSASNGCIEYDNENSKCTKCAVQFIMGTGNDNGTCNAI